ncbi:MAG: tripartite tricarboxylate transporter TctB family protein [Betaproteobacteria bacterium]|jgi:putative tricarboxylic transport membrane protein|nr:tripartite tricarboxylate transporter TctB family protein [Pseudomonadota bacterium]NBO94906.1 tripartite tricarboxylate transporter TctB family protein [Betaproteobacteria bacterium]NBP34304.1 tripartite tricarboxylate transporter TctB family protein [Betaproteobacteria bacterium]NBQ93945.1 tripartite tricarboxylate transporter TctB family protein [Betaproteobacteria bacterium]NBT70461.1 tripartite tricarboxylate transporter TctB family protein [Betaproteobacteria bacterium]
MMNLRPTRIAGLILLALSLLAGWQVSLIPSPPVYAEVGPHLVPGVTVLMLGLLALAYLFADHRHQQADALNDPDEQPNKGAGKRLQWYGLGLVALIVLIPVTGLGPAGAFAFAGIAKAFDSTKTWADLVIGIIFTTLVWIVFAKGLGVQLGPLVRGLIS